MNEPIVIKPTFEDKQAEIVMFFICIIVCIFGWILHSASVLYTFSAIGLTAGGILLIQFIHVHSWKIMIKKPHMVKQNIRGETEYSISDLRWKIKYREFSRHYVVQVFSVREERTVATLRPTWDNVYSLITAIDHFGQVTDDEKSVIAGLIHK